MTPKASALMELEPVRVRPIEPEPADFYRNATAAEWEARMKTKYPSLADLPAVRAGLGELP